MTNTPPGKHLSSAQQDEHDARPVSELPSGGVPPFVVALGFVILAVGLFLVLEGRRQSTGHADISHSSANEVIGVAPSVPALQIPPPPPPPLPVKIAPPLPPPPPKIEYVYRPAPPQPPVIQYVDRPAPPQPQPNLQLSHLNEPALVIDTGDAASAANLGGEDAVARAVVLRNRSALVPQGTLIPAVLETPIDSTRPGPVRALTSADTRGFDGTRVLIPRGSRLVGDFHSDVQAGQSRVLVTWNRLVRPDGVAIRLTSPATDERGGMGIAGEVDTHLLARVSSVVLQTALTVGTNLASRAGNGSVIIGLPGQVLPGAGQTLVPTGDQKPTIRVREGAAITVFAARDLDFGGAASHP